MPDLWALTERLNAGTLQTVILPLRVPEKSCDSYIHATFLLWILCTEYSYLRGLLGHLCDLLGIFAACDGADDGAHDGLGGEVAVVCAAVGLVDAVVGRRHQGQGDLQTGRDQPRPTKVRLLSL